MHMPFDEKWCPSIKAGVRNQSKAGDFTFEHQESTVSQTWRAIDRRRRNRAGKPTPALLSDRTYRCFLWHPLPPLPKCVQSATHDPMNRSMNPRFIIIL
jgi:hypothetical protein